MADSKTMETEPSSHVYGPITLTDNAIAVLGDIHYHIEREGLEDEDLALKFKDVQNQLGEWKAEFELDQFGTGKCSLDYETAQNRDLIQGLLDRVEKHLEAAKGLLSVCNAEQVNGSGPWWGLLFGWYDQKGNHTGLTAKNRLKLTEIADHVTHCITRLRDCSSYARSLSLSAWKGQLGREFSTIPQGDHHAQARENWQEGTCQWIFAREEYQRWLEGNEQNFLWVKANAGMGKTVLAAAIIEDLCRKNNCHNMDKRVTALDEKCDYHCDLTSLHSNKTISRCGIAYFYCDHKRQSEQIVSEIFANLIAQLSLQNLAYRHRLAQYLAGEQKSYTPDSYPARARDHKNLLGLLSQALSEFDRLYFVIDAIDEFRDNETSMVNNKDFLLDRLTELPEKGMGKIKIVVTGRPILDVQVKLREQPSLEITSEANSSDIELFLHAQLDLKKQQANSRWRDALSQAPMGDKSLQVMIVETLVGRAAGM